MEFVIEKLVYGGAGLGRKEGKVYFVPFVIPGERVEVEVLREKKEYGEAKVLRVIEPSEKRIEPRCPLFTRCGGCDYQHMEYSLELEWKKRIVEETLLRIGKIEIEVPPINPGREYGYRNKVEWVVENGRVGYHERRGRKIIPVERCELLEEEINKVIPEGVPEEVKRITIRSSGKEILFICDGYMSSNFTRWAEELPGNVILLEQGKMRYRKGSPFLEMELLGRRFQVSMGSFFQVNREKAEELFKTAIEWLEPEEDERIVDAYCGVGVLSVLISGMCGSVYGIEKDRFAVVDARENVRRHGAMNVIVMRGDAGRGMRGLRQVKKVFLDPPREGLSSEVFDAISYLSPSVLVYTSCNPSTFARDVKKLYETGYRLDKIKAIDMFPRTHHIEVIGRFVRQDVDNLDF